MARSQAPRPTPARVEQRVVAPASPPEAPASPPVHVLRHGRLRAAVWHNPAGKGPMYTVTLTRSFRDGERWRDSTSFSFQDLPAAAKLLFDAHSWVGERIAADRHHADMAEESILDQPT